jgi:hypothetical protein
MVCKVILDIELPDNVTEKELEHFLAYKFLGHAIDGCILSKFKHEELDVNYFDIDRNG